MNVYILKILVYLQIVFDVNLNFIEQFDFLEIFCQLIPRGPAPMVQTPLEMFSLFFDENIFDHIVRETNRKRTVLKRFHVEPITLDEIKVFSIFVRTHVNCRHAF